MDPVEKLRQEFSDWKKAQSDIIDGLIQSNKDMAAEIEQQGKQIEKLQSESTGLLEKFRTETIN